MRSMTLATIVVISGLMAASSASAQGLEGALRFHLEVPFLGFDSTTRTPDGLDEGDTTNTTTFGPSADGLGFGVGYGVTADILVGANVVLNLTSRSPEEGDSESTTNLALAPYVEFLFGEGDIRPFVGGNLFLSVESEENITRSRYGLGGLGGVHIFLADAFSIDVSGRLYFNVGSDTVESGVGDATTDITQVGLMALVGVSGWSL